MTLARPFHIVFEPCDVAGAYPTLKEAERVLCGYLADNPEIPRTDAWILEFRDGRRVGEPVFV
jgi:hypothetical protein